MEFKKTRGRQKIVLRKIENVDDKYATFSKRRGGLYKKASELCCLSGNDIGIVIFSPTGKPYSFFSPNINAITSRFLSCDATSESDQLVEAHTRAKIEELNRELRQLKARAEEANERGRILDHKLGEEHNTEKGWWEKPIEEFSREEAERMKNWLQSLQAQIKQQFNQKTLHAASASSSFNVMRRGQTIQYDAYANEPINGFNTFCGFPLPKFPDTLNMLSTEPINTSTAFSASYPPNHYPSDIAYPFVNGNTGAPYISSSPWSAMPTAEMRNIPYAYGNFSGLPQSETGSFSSAVYRVMNNPENVAAVGPTEAWIAHHGNHYQNSLFQSTTFRGFYMGNDFGTS